MGKQGWEQRTAALTIVTDPATGKIRGILRDWHQALPAARRDIAELEVVAAPDHRSRSLSPRRRP